MGEFAAEAMAAVGKGKRTEHLLVDGYNLAHAWGHVEPLFAEGLDAVVEALVRELRELHDARGIRITIVLDGQGTDLEIVRPFREETFSLLYSPRSNNADSIIEQMVGVSESPRTIYVVSRDQALITSIEGSGASAVSPELLLEWIGAARKRSREAARKTGRSGSASWGNRLEF